MFKIITKFLEKINKSPCTAQKEPSNPLGKVHAITTANVPVDNTLHNKQTGEGGRANSEQAQCLSQNGS